MKKNLINKFKIFQQVLRNKRFRQPLKIKLTNLEAIEFEMSFFPDLGSNSNYLNTTCVSMKL